MRALVTGVAGFIGSNLAARLLMDGWDVRGVDCFTDYYAESIKRDNLAPLNQSTSFEMVEADLLVADLETLLQGVDVVFHEAGQAGVRGSWASGFRVYNETNVDVTQRLLEAVHRNPVRRFVFASSSSVYGNAPDYPTHEADSTRPHSPYGVTKLAAELLCCAYAHNFGVPVVSLRYFTVYGPGQRPDMGIHRMIEAALNQTTFNVFGDGSQVRDFTYVGDVVEANVLAATADVEPGTVLNVAGGGSISVAELLALVGEVVGREVPIVWGDAQPGDVQRTGGSTDRAEQLLGWTPQMDIRSGVTQQVAWHRQHPMA
ncbi:MAG: NAD-dependent epimerase/dehydratase family protein [Ilumatobacteraceae bacterium]